MNITEGNSEDLAFLCWALFCEAMTLGEMRQWAMSVIEIEESPPLYIYDLIEFKGYLKDLSSVFGFDPSGEPDELSKSALTGIALLRGVEPFESCDKEYCLGAVQKRPEVVEKLQYLLPFVSEITEF